MNEQGAAPATFNLADIWEAVADRCVDRQAVVCGDRRLTYGGLEARANRLAHALAARGVGPGDHVGLYLRNGNEYLEGMLAAYKLRAVPINVNFRYVADELRHLFTDAELTGVICDRGFTPQVAEVRGSCERLRWCVAVEDGSSADLTAVGAEQYEDVLAAHEPGRDFGPRRGDDPYVIYTGGTTGMPKGVVWHQEDAFFACVGGGDPMRLLGPVERPAEVMDRIVDGGFVMLPVAPLMHAAAQWTSLSWLFAGGSVVLLRGSFDPRAVWETAAAEAVNLIVIVGDAVARPLVDEWDRSGPYELPSLLAVGSGGAPLTPTLKDRLVDLVAPATVTDGFGSSETGAQGAQRLEKGAKTGGVTRFSPTGDGTAVLDEATLQPVAPGSGAVGRVALSGRIPQRYHNDPERTATTFVESHGTRWVLTGDLATVEEDGTIQLLGRGSVCINTGGEKVFPEEVEAALKAHGAVYDAVVVGVDDERWGERVVAVVQPVGETVDVDLLIGHCRRHVAGYKVPREVVVVDRVERSPAGKADYPWARRVATGAVAGGA